MFFNQHKSERQGIQSTLPQDMQNTTTLSSKTQAPLIATNNTLGAA